MNGWDNDHQGAWPAGAAHYPGPQQQQQHPGYPYNYPAQPGFAPPHQPGFAPPHQPQRGYPQQPGFSQQYPGAGYPQQPGSGYPQHQQQQQQQHYPPQHQHHQQQQHNDAPGPYPPRGASLSSHASRSSLSQHAPSHSPSPNGPSHTPTPGTYTPPPPIPSVIAGAPPTQHYHAHLDARHAVTFRFSGTKDTVLSCDVLDPAGRAPFRVRSCEEKKKRRTVVSGAPGAGGEGGGKKGHKGKEDELAAGGQVLANIDWEHASPTMEYRGEKKVKLKNWMELNFQEKTRKIKHADKEYHWVLRDEMMLFEPLDKPGYPFAIWRDSTGVTELQMFQDALVIPGMLEACVVCVVVMQSGRKLGDESGVKEDKAAAIGEIIGALVQIGSAL